MGQKQRLKLLVDVLMTIALLLLMAYELIGQTTHEVIGTAMFLLFLFHHALNWSWSRSLLKGRYTPFRVAQTLLVGLILLWMVSQMVSGVLLSRHLYPFLPSVGGTFAARSLHMLGAYWCFVLMSLHLGLHWSVMMAAVKRRTGPGSLARTILLRGIGGGLAVFGVVAFYRREVGVYLLGQIQFAFFDFEEPLLFFFLDYLAIMGLFVWVGHYLGLLFRRLPQKQRGDKR